MDDEKMNNEVDGVSPRQNQPSQQPSGQQPQDQQTGQQPDDQQSSGQISGKDQAQSGRQGGQGGYRKQLLVIVIVLILLIGGGVAAWQSGILSGIGLSSSKNAVAFVNEEPITRTELDKRVDWMIEGIPSYTEDQRPDYEEFVLDQLIDEELLLQYAEEQGLSVSKAEIDTEYDKIIQEVGGEDLITRRLEERGATIDDLRDILRKQLLREKVGASLSQSFEITEEEIRQQYEKLVERPGGDEIPPFEQIKPQIRLQLEQQRQSNVLEPFIKNLRTNADIERKLVTDEEEAVDETPTAE